jgi:DNA-binding transcriptional ArsR family regulator
MTMKQYRMMILQALYEERARGFLHALDAEDLARRIGIPWGKLRHEVTYLEEKGFVTSRNRQVGTRIFCALHLTAEGIDFIEAEVSGGAEIDADYTPKGTLHDQRPGVQAEIEHQQGVLAGLVEKRRILEKIVAEQGVANVDIVIRLERVKEQEGGINKRLDELRQQLSSLKRSGTT